MSYEAARQELKDLDDTLQYSPQNPKVSTDLSGWTKPGVGSVCVHCAGRIMARGCGYMFKGWEPVWLKKDFKGCDLIHCKNQSAALDLALNNSFTSPQGMES